MSYADVNGVSMYYEEQGSGDPLVLVHGGVAGGEIFADIAPGARSSSPEYYTNVGPSVFFRANDNIHGLELWAIAPPL